MIPLLSTGATGLPITLPERLFDFSDRWNPMLVRELRRVFKSKMFVTTFLLLLLFCWLTAVVMILNNQSQLAFLEMGGQFCAAFLAILLIPLCFVVPLGLFDTVCQEFLESTRETLAVTTLSDKALFWGFMHGATLHALVYYSAILPFLAFGYLLKGVSVAGILLSLLITFLAGTLAALWGYMLGACTKKRSARGFCSILTLFGNAIVFMIACPISMSVVQESIAGGLSSAASGMFCFFCFASMVSIVLAGIGQSQFALVDPLMRPYRIFYDQQGNILFKPPFQGVYYDTDGKVITQQQAGRTTLDPPNLVQPESGNS